MRLFAWKETCTGLGRHVLREQPVAEQEQYDERERERQAGIRLDQHPEVDHSGDNR